MSNLKLLKKIHFILITLTLFNQKITGEEQNPNCSRIFTISYYEFGILYSSKTKKGFDVDFVNELKKRSGCKFEEIEQTRARIWYDLEKGRLDFATTGISTPERNQFAFFSDYIKAKFLTVIRKKIDDKTLNKFLKNKNLRLGIVRGTVYTNNNLASIIEKLKTENRLEESSNEYSVFEKLLHNRIDATISNIGSINEYSKSLKNLNNAINIVNWSPEDPGVSVGFIISKKNFNDKEILKWNKLVKNMIKDGTIFKMLKKYYTESEIKKYHTFIN